MQANQIHALAVVPFDYISTLLILNSRFNAILSLESI